MGPCLSFFAVSIAWPLANGAGATRWRCSLAGQSSAQSKLHVSVFVNFLRDRNVVVENAKRQMRAKGLRRAGGAS